MEEFKDELDDSFEPNISDFEEDEDTVEKSGITKNLIICIVVALVLVVAAVVIQKIYSNHNKSSEKSSSSASSTEKSTQEDNKEIKNDEKGVNENVQGTVDSQWTEVTDVDKLDISSESISAIFTVTDVKHFVRVVDSSDMELRTELTGNISGFTGSYKLYVPYDKGSNIIVGNSFNVNVRVGSREKMKVIVEISY